MRELENAIERACALCDEDMISANDLPPQIVAVAQGEKADQESAAMSRSAKSLDEFIQQQERDTSKRRCEPFKGAREKAASVLGISMATLYRKLEIKGRK